jgi:hypothetical protein
MFPDTCWYGHFFLALACGTRAQSLSAPFSYTLVYSGSLTIRCALLHFRLLALTNLSLVALVHHVQVLYTTSSSQWALTQSYCLSLLRDQGYTCYIPRRVRCKRETRHTELLEVATREHAGMWPDVPRTQSARKYIKGESEMYEQTSGMNCT